jgi:hypothetical protein
MPSREPGSILSDILAVAVDLSQSALSIIALVALGLAVISIAYAMVLSRRVRRLRRVRAMRAPAPGAPSNGSMDVDVDLEELRAVMAHAVQRVGMVRFDAFEDMGGKLSFSAALLDGEGSGIVLSSISSRSDSRVYAKPVERGSSRYNLSGEEEEAIRRALGAVVR